MAITPELRPATEQDLATLIAIERQSFPVPNWAVDTFRRYDCTVAEVGGQICGFLSARQIFAGDDSTPPEREILNIAVAPQFRRFGIATALLKRELLYRADFFLEVRESNHAARSLYQRLGFLEIARRDKYYDHPPETAIVMCLKWC